ncbi:hypothetical protein PABG_06674 [Paracoccidioides brasiliensis Pb03]|nr:hypothetical protein PABG_06674 [Paracoccidioides brasiliensis Pb03]
MAQSTIAETTMTTAAAAAAAAEKPLVEVDAPSDVSLLWQQALDKYQESTGKNLKQIPSFGRVEDILADAELQQSMFSTFRHNGEMGDRLRSSVARNASFLESLRFVVDGAALAYPPTTAISSAFFYFLQMTKHISSDYDKIVDFFDTMKNCLERLSIIQVKLPSIPAYTSHVVRVFSAMLSVCGIATAYIKKGRFKKWVRVLREGGGDGNLQSAHAAMEKSLTELESASVTVILATTEGLKQDTKGIVATTERIDISNQRIDTRTERIELSILSQRDQFHEMSANFEKLLKSQRKDAKKLQLYDPGKVVDARTRKHVAFNSVKLCFETSIDPAWQTRDIEYSFVKGSAKWVLEEEAYQAWREGGNNPYLWISGDAGFGKTCIAFSLARELTESVASEPKTSVAAFYFQSDQAELRSVSNAMSSIIIQIAKRNTSYCEQVSSEIGKSDGDVDIDNWSTDLWERFFQSKFGSKSNNRLFLVIDGLDEISAEDRVKFLGLLAQVRKESLNMHVLFTSRTDIPSSPKLLQPLEITATKDKLLPDMTLLVKDRLKRLPNLYALHKKTKRKILSRVLEKADSMLYVDHMLRRYNSIGREGAVLKDLETNLPDNLQSLYNNMLAELTQRRTSEHMKIFKNLLAWLAFSKRLLTVGEVDDLTTLLGQDRSYNIIEEVEGKSSRILRIARTFDEENQDDESDGEGDPPDDASVASKMIADDNAASLQFLDRSLRDYFRSADVNEEELRTDVSSAHLIIFEMSVNVICGMYRSKGAKAGDQVKNYAINFWARHFLDLDPLSATEKDVVRVIEPLVLILSNHNNAAKELESAPVYRDVFGKTVKRQNDFLKLVAIWVERASDLKVEKLNDGARSWVESAVRSLLKIMVPLARGHVLNWFQQIHEEHDCFGFAADALLMASSTEIFGSTDLHPIIPARHITKAKIIKSFADVFSDIPKDETAYRAVALVLKNKEHYDEAIVACKTALAVSSSDTGRFRTSVVLAQIYCKLYGDEVENGSDAGGSEEDSSEYNAMAYKEICEALSKRPPIDNSPASKEVLLLIREALLIRGDCERVIKKMDAAVKSFGEARTICPSEILGGDSLNEITSILGEQGRFTELMENVELWTPWERMAWLTANDEDDRHDIFRNAATVTGKEDFLVKTYEDIIAYLDRSKSSAAIRWELGSYYQTVKGDFAKVKPWFYSIVDGDSFISPATGEEDLVILSETQLNLCDVIYEEFRRAETLEKKIASMEELKRLQTRRRRAAVDDGDVYETASSIVHANMLRKMGPAHEFQNILEKTFQTCISSLTDDKGWNDQNSLCLLAKVLATVGGLEKEAQIAFSAQFYIIDPEVEHGWSDEESVWSTDGENVEEEGDSASDTGCDDSGSSGSSPSSSSGKKESNVNGDFAPDTAYVCQGECVDDEIESWETGPVYLCMICTNCDLCNACYEKRQAYNKDSSNNTHWRLYCGANHWYLKGPVDGWKGIKDGHMTIGEEKIKFMDWLEELRVSKWKKAWEEFWMREEAQGDIL